MEVFDDSLSSKGKDDYKTFCSVDTDGKVTGYICYGPIPMTDSNYDLYWIATDKNRLRTGLGSDLLHFVELLVIENKGRKIYLDTSSTEKYVPARSFYTRHGYAVVSTLEDYYRIGDHKMVFAKDVSGLSSSQEKYPKHHKATTNK
jgi:ribosomal protein S18 acetylase RimI-like enzyme